MPKQANQTVIVLARQLYEATPDGIAPEWSMPDILSKVRTATGTGLDRKTIQRWADAGGWKRAPGKPHTRAATLREAVALSVDIPPEKAEPKPKPPKAKRPTKAQKPVTAPKGASTKPNAPPKGTQEAEAPEIITVAQQEAAKAVAKVRAPTRAELVRDAMIERLADYIKGGRAVSMGAISALADQLKRDREARFRLATDLRAVPYDNPERLAARDALLETRDLIQIAKLGTIFNAPQLTLVFDSDKSQEENSEQTMTWEGGFIGPTAHMPNVPKEEGGEGE